MTIDRRMLGVILLVVGALLFLYGGLSARRASQPEPHTGVATPAASETARFPLWGGVALVVAGGAFLIMQPPRE
jgi:hypothetical protein